MKTYIKAPLILLVSIFLSSCAALRQPDMTKIAVGMDKNTVIANLGKKPDGIAGSKKYAGGVVEVVQYLHEISQNNRPVYYWLFFYNDKLMQFGRANGDWQMTADQIVAENNI